MVYIPEDSRTDGSEEKGKSDSGGDVVSRPVELLLKMADGEGDSKEVPCIHSPCKPAGEEHGSLKRRKHHGEFEGVEGSVISLDPALLLGGHFEESVSRVVHCGGAATLFSFFSK